MQEPAVRRFALWGFDDFGLVCGSWADGRMAHVTPELLDLQPSTCRLARLIGVDAATFCSVD
jgi:hypothetical protein